MSITKTNRDYEYDYLSLAYQVEDLLQRKTAAYSVDSEIEATHQRLMELAREIMQADDPRDREYDYLAAAYKIQDLLQQKSRAHHMTFEFQEMQSQMDETGRKLGWGRGGAAIASAEKPYLSDRLSRLQTEIQELRANLS